MPTLAFGLECCSNLFKVFVNNNSRSRLALLGLVAAAAKLFLIMHQIRIASRSTSCRFVWRLQHDTRRSAIYVKSSVKLLRALFIARGTRKRKALLERRHRLPPLVGQCVGIRQMFVNVDRLGTQLRRSF